jgi:hypothetical protein
LHQELLLFRLAGSRQLYLPSANVLIRCLRKGQSGKSGRALRKLSR